MILDVKNLKVRHGQLLAVDDLNLSVSHGEVIGLIGANGSGKTTLLRSIAGAHIAESGSIKFKNVDVTTTASHQRVRDGLSLVPEGRKLFTDMTVEENLLLGAQGGRSGEWTVDKVFEIFPNLIKRRFAKTGVMSGGEQQATAIGRALMCNPDVLILDEVSLGLSPLVVEQVYESLSKLLQHNTTLIVVEQDLSRIMKFASRAVCMLEGKVVLDQPMKDVTRKAITDAYFGLQKSQRKMEKQL